MTRDETSPVKACACGARYAESEWRELPFVGVQPDGKGGSLVLRNCVGCQSTIARASDEDGPKRGCDRGAALVVRPRPLPATRHRRTTRPPLEHTTGTWRREKGQ